MRKRMILLAVSVLSALSLLICAGRLGTAAETVTLPVVMYHHISEDVSRLGPYVISPEELESDLAYLTGRGYTSVTAEDLIAWTEGRFAMPEKPVMLTFDDGYESTFVYAQPILARYGMRGVTAVIGSVAQQYSETEDHHLAYSHLSWETLGLMAKAGVFELECHTWDMHRLSPRRGCAPMEGESDADYRAALSEDLTRFQEEFSRKLGLRADVLVMPYGAYTNTTLEIAEKLGFRCAFTCEEKINQLTGSPDELMRIGRYNRPSGPDSEEFFSRWG